MSARRPTWLGGGETDYGLPPFARRRELLGSLAGARRALVRFLVGGWDGARLRGAAARSAPRALVSLGSGREPPPGWIGCDLVRRPPAVRFADLRRALPFRGDSLNGLLLEHALEHLDWDDVIRLLDECARVLRPGAPIRVVCPDARLVARMILDPDDADVREQVRFDRELHRWPQDGLLRWRAINRLSHQWGQHRSLVSAESLSGLLTRAGFTEVAEVPLDSSRVFPSPPSTHQRFGAPAAEAVTVEGLAPAAPAS